ncbi:hypothetical protein AB0L22_09190 [Micromonospora haikouensis]|uniref:hypothetical protein n=1 Tax=Micromonospora haikouensis TaxID=686309 RepID=UPI00341F63B7
MTVSPDRILTQRHVTCMAAVDTMPHIASRIRNLLTHGRRITVARRLTYMDRPPEVTVGLTVDEITDWRSGHGIGVHLKPGIHGFAVSAHPGDNDTEAGEWKRYHTADGSDPFQRRENMTRVDITGGLPGDGPAPNDLLVIRHWNSAGACDERVIAFDAGPRDGEYRAGRWLYGAALGPQHMEDRLRQWDHGRVPDADLETWAGRAAELMAVIAAEG